MPEVKSPYNFVPLNDKVAIPKWGNRVSQDIPFEEGLSGKIKLSIEAKTPIFVRGEELVGNDNKPYFDFFKLHDTYCIPGTSIKGELASVMEIMTFGKLKQYNDERFRVRDMADRANLVGQSEKCGFLIKTTNGYAIQDCGKPVLISHSSLRAQLGFEIYGLKTLKDKYEAYGKRNLSVNVDYIEKKDRGYTYLQGSININSKKQGVLVFTNAIDNKRNEFVFLKTDKTYEMDVDKDVFDNFAFTYFEDSESIAGQYWKEKWNKSQPIPVFYKLNKNEEVQSMGLTQLYKLSYKNQISNLIPECHDKNGEKDFVDLIFGNIDEESETQKGSLKGRVSIEAATAKGTPKHYGKKPLEIILGEPKASFYPYYIRQEVDSKHIIAGNYKTYNSDKAEIAGRKRYAIKNELDLEMIQVKEEQKNVCTSIHPLDAGTVFETTLHFHNLLPVELGALLSSITFHNNADICKHSLGMAKPFGMGHVDIEMYVNGISEDDTIKYMKIFESYMNRKLNTSWCKTDQITELFTIATPVALQAKLRYLVLNPPKIDEFKALKIGKNQENNRIEKKALPKYSKFMNFKTECKSLLAPGEDINVNFKVLSDIARDAFNKHLNDKKAELLQKFE